MMVDGSKRWDFVTLEALELFTCFLAPVHVSFFYRICLQFFCAFVDDFVNSFLVVASNIIGARTGRFSNSRKNGESSANDHGQHIPGHSLPVRNFILTNLTAD